MNWRRHGWFLLRGKMYNMEDVLKCDGWTSCQSLLEETVEDEKINLARNPLIERRVSYKKALEQARKIYPDFFSTKTYKLEPNIQVGPKENEAIELDEIPISGDKSNSDTAKMKIVEQMQPGRATKTMHRPSIKLPWSPWSKGCQHFKDLFSTKSLVEQTQKRAKHSEKMDKLAGVAINEKATILVKRFSFEKKKEESEVERGLLYVLFRPARARVSEKNILFA